MSLDQRMSVRVRKSGGNYKNDDFYIGGDLTAESGVITTVVSATTVNAVLAGTQTSQQLGASGAVVTAVNIIRQVIDLAQVASGLATIVHTVFTSGPAALIGSGDYLVALTQPAESGAVIFGIPAASAGTISIKYINMTNVDPAAQEYRFQVIRATSISN